MYFRHKQFESFVNSERCKTIGRVFLIGNTFESFVNSERCKTDNQCFQNIQSLRALLIQKDVKLLTNGKVKRPV